jgi:hypothetical protein
MHCHTLAERIEDLQPTASLQEVARTCLLLSHAVDDHLSLEDDQLLADAWRDISLRLQAATDQQAAVTEELERLAESDPEKFSSSQIWILIRAIKVQSQILQLYMGGQVLDV